MPQHWAQQHLPQQAQTASNMRASEFIAEGQAVGRLSKTKSYATVGLHKFVDPNRADRIYELNRIMMAAASTDGTFVPDIDGESWAGRFNISAPYTEEEHNMLHHAYTALGIEISDAVSHPNTEPDTIHKHSPVKAFKGYAR